MDSMDSLLKLGIKYEKARCCYLKYWAILLC